LGMSRRVSFSRFARISFFHVIFCQARPSVYAWPPGIRLVDRAEVYPVRRSRLLALLKSCATVETRADRSRLQPVRVIVARGVAADFWRHLAVANVLDVVGPRSFNADEDAAALTGLRRRANTRSGRRTLEDDLHRVVEIRLLCAFWVCSIFGFYNIDGK